MKSIETANQAAAKRQQSHLRSSRETLTIPAKKTSLTELSSEQFEFCFKALPIGLALNKIIYSKTGKPTDFITLDVNPYYERTFGVKREEILNTKAAFYPLMTDISIDWVTIFGRVASSGRAEHFEVIYPANGNTYFVNVYSPKKSICFASFMVISEYKNKILNKLAEREKIEAQLKESLEKCRYLVKHAPTGIFEINLVDGPKISTVNDALCQILGYTEQELLAINPMNIFYPESRERFQEFITKITNGKKADESTEYHVKTKDGVGLWGIIKVMVESKKGEATSALIVMHDITAKRKAQEELIFAEKRFRRLYETTQDGIMARDLTGRMIDCNHAYAKMLGYTRKELRRLSVKQLLPEKWHEQREKIANKVIQTGHSIVFEREYKRKDGSIFPASVRTWRLTDGKGKVIGIWSIVREISEQKQLQKNLEEHADVLQKIVEDRTKQLKDSERLVAIGQTAGMVGHDLRNPLQTLIGELYLAKSEVDSLVDGEAKSNLEESIHVIEEQVVYMDKIVSDLQAFVQPVKIDKKPVNLSELVTNVLSTVIIPANVTVQIQNRGDGLEIKADPQLLKRVLINLVTNALQAMPSGGILSLNTQVNPQGQASISVQDTGVGISDKIKSHIFSPLFTTKPRGQGFGLAVCKRVIEAHGGTISFESTEGKGALFIIAFPSN